MTSNVQQVLKQLSGKLERQVPFAMSKALNDTAFDVQRHLSSETETYLENPTPFTKRAFGVRKASKRNPRAQIFIRDAQAEYLKYQIEGGVREDNLQPVNIRLNKFGNIPSLRGGRKVEQLLARPNTYKGTINGTYGIWQRQKRGTKLLAVLGQRATYRPRFPYKRLVMDEYKRKIFPNTRKAVLFAIRTAR